MPKPGNYRDVAHRIARLHGTPESNFKHEVGQLLLRLELAGQLVAIRMNTGQAVMGGRRVRFGYPGMADYYIRVKPRCAVCIEGRPRWHTLWLELKSDEARSNKKTEAAQEAFRSLATGLGDHYFQVKTIEEVQAALRAVRGY